MITKETDKLGKFLHSEEFKCDYMILKHESPMNYGEYKQEGMKSCQYDNIEMEYFAQSREVKGINSKEKNSMASKQVVILKDENFGLVQQVEEKDEEIKRLTVELETSNKSIYDKERMLKQEQKERTH
jgi:hypothetical protein